MAELATIRHLLAEASPVTEDEITPEKHLVKDLELDSFSLLDPVSVFEQEFSISIPDRDLSLIHIYPVFTAYGTEDWYYDDRGNILHWPVDRYFNEGRRSTIFLGETVQKYHKTLTTYVNGLIQTGFEITGLIEPEPSEEMLHTVPGMTDELRRPMMLLVSARKR